MCQNGCPDSTICQQGFKRQTRTKEGPSLVHKYNLTDLEVHASGSLSMEECSICFNTGRIQINVLTTLSFYLLDFKFHVKKVENLKHVFGGELLFLHN